MSRIIQYQFSCLASFAQHDGFESRQQLLGFGTHRMDVLQFVHFPDSQHLACFPILAAMPECSQSRLVVVICFHFSWVNA